jgi:hypothetical protein
VDLARCRWQAHREEPRRRGFRSCTSTASPREGPGEPSPVGVGSIDHLAGLGPVKSSRGEGEVDVLGDAPGEVVDGGGFAAVGEDGTEDEVDAGGVAVGVGGGDEVGGVGVEGAARPAKNTLYQLWPPKSEHAEAIAASLSSSLGWVAFRLQARREDGLVRHRSAEGGALPGSRPKRGPRGAPRSDRGGPVWSTRTPIPAPGRVGSGVARADGAGCHAEELVATAADLARIREEHEAGLPGEMEPGEGIRFASPSTDG